VPEIRANGVSLYYEEHGTGDAIVGLHGAGSSAVFWADAAPELAKRGRVILYDRRGSFRSERPEPYTTNVHQHADDAAALIETLSAAPAILVGRSYGGAIAIDLALRYSDQVRAVVQLEGDGGITLSPVAMRELAELEEQLFPGGEVDMGSVGERAVRTIVGNEAWEGLPEEARQVFAANGPTLVAELRGGYPEITVEELGTIDKPTLLVGAKDSVFDYAEVIDVTAAAMPSARVEWVEGGHAINPAHPVVLSFIDEVLARD
jgi:pimeloyl-ACP methyl ester carboxylesterase